MIKTALPFFIVKYEKKIEDQLDLQLSQLRAGIPQDSKWGVKKNSEGQNVFWLGYKGHLAIGASSQYIPQSLFSSGSFNDGKAAIPSLKEINELASLPNLMDHTMDAGYDFEAIYEQVYRLRHRSLIAYDKRNELEPVGFNEHFAPTCFRAHPYRYNSYDAKYETLKYTRPKECKHRPLLNDGICQKIYKVKITTDLQKYAAPTRSSKTWKTLFNRRTAVEQVNDYLKEFLHVSLFDSEQGNVQKFISTDLQRLQTRYRPNRS